MCLSTAGGLAQCYWGPSRLTTWMQPPSSVSNRVGTSLASHQLSIVFVVQEGLVTWRGCARALVTLMNSSHPCRCHAACMFCLLHAVSGDIFCDCASQEWSEHPVQYRALVVWVHFGTLHNLMPASKGVRGGL